jgi:predicted dehydrogenase
MNRRDFLLKTTLTGAGIVLASSLESKSKSQNKKLGIALVGLGNYASGQLAPALQQTKYCYLAGIVTGTPSKAKDWADRYSIPSESIYNYENFDKIASNPKIDIVYVVLPNSMHAEYTIRAAKAGKHVICEKPMAINVKECQDMIAACANAGKQLSIGYRLYFEPYNRHMMLLGQKKTYGNLKELTAGFGGSNRNPQEWRLNRKLSGGGPLVDLGIYCLEGCIYTSGELPVSLTARYTTKDKAFFKDVEGSIEWDMNFPSGFVAKCKSSYEENYNFLKAKAEKGEFGLDSAFGYGGQAGYAPEGKMSFERVNQQAKQMDAIALSYMENKPSIVPGELGLRDVFIIEKIYEAANSGRLVDLKGIPGYNYKI